MRIPPFHAPLALCIAIAVTAAGCEKRSSSAAPSTRYVAQLTGLNSKAAGQEATGDATFEVTGDSLTISVRMRGVPPDMMHLQHFHGFPEGRQAVCPTMDADKNGDGMIDLAETEPVLGTTMVPFHDDPVSLEIVKDTYPKASADGSYSYQKTVPLSALDSAFNAKFNAHGIELDKRVVVVHGVPADAKLASSVASLPGIPAQVTIPIACGAITKAS